jgi:predicted DNA-binding transcriptional regulator YafY
MQPLVEEWFGVENVEVRGEDCLVKTNYPDGDWMYGFILSFGKMVEVLEPEAVREKIRKMAEDISEIYQKR